MVKLGDAIAQCVLETFKKLPSKAKPRAYPDGSCEWVPLSGIVLGRKSSVPNRTSYDDGAAVVRDLTCVSLGTGMRCLPVSRVPLSKGRTLHDWHAEVVALRGFNHYLLKECHAMVNSPLATSHVLRKRAVEELSKSDFQPFAINDDIQIYMYCSEAPCGDASMELIMAAQDDATPWTKPAQSSDSAMTGRGYFSELGVVRRKPARGDAPETLSKSCTDKLAMKQCTSILSSILSLLIHPATAYVRSVVLPSSQHVAAATTRAFGPEGRMAGLSNDGTTNTWQGGYAFRPFEFLETGEEFMFSRRAFPDVSKTTGSNITAMWTPYGQEVLIGGSIQGNKQFSLRGSSVISKLGLWKAALSLSQSLELEEVEVVLKQSTYAEIKTCPLLEDRQHVKDDVRKMALQNWIRNDGGDVFGLEGM